MRIALADLRLEHLTVVYPGETRYPLDKHISVVPITHIALGDAKVLLRPLKV
jgi:hypothetical protein